MEAEYKWPQIWYVTEWHCALSSKPQQLLRELSDIDDDDVFVAGYLKLNFASCNEPNLNFFIKHSVKFSYNLYSIQDTIIMKWKLKQSNHCLRMSFLHPFFNFFIIRFHWIWCLDIKIVDNIGMLLFRGIVLYLLIVYSLHLSINK